MSRTRAALALIVMALSIAGVASCGGNRGRGQTATREHRRARRVSGESAASAQGSGRCDANGPRHEVSEYDTSGDSVPDVRKVFLRVGTPPLARLVLVCREADLNGDGTKDVVRYYNDEGRPIREESDRDFDGATDEIVFFDRARIVRVEEDTNRDGRIDMKTFYEQGRPVRTERDLAGRSTETQWNPDRWEYFENARVVRIGTDINHDNVVDRWDRVPTPDAPAAGADADAGVETGDAAVTDAPVAQS